MRAYNMDEELKKMSNKKKYISISYQEQVRKQGSGQDGSNIYLAF
jgi:hypothetical protein